jgi:signal transduction histidine kinase/CheY-like chemotaxis protein
MTNPWHGLFIRPNPLAQSLYGPLWYVTAGINYCVVFSAAIDHARIAALAKDRTLQSHYLTLTIAALIPASLSVLYVSKAFGLRNDPTALGFAISCALFLYAVRRQNLFTLENVSLPEVLKHDIDPVLVIESDARLLYANRRAEQLFGSDVLQPGFHIDDLLSKSIPTFSLQAQMMLPLDVRNRRAEKPHRFVDTENRTSWLTIEVSDFERRGASRDAICLRMRDKTTLRSAERESESRHELLNAISSAMEEGLVVHDHAGTILFVNDEFARLCGSTVARIERGTVGLKALIGPLFQTTPPESIRPLLRDRGAMLAKRSKCDVILRDGRIFEIDTFPVDTAVGFVGRAWRLNDVTLTRHESQKMVEAQKLEGLGLLAGGIAHDFNNLLTGIMGNAELAEMSLRDDSGAQPYLSAILRSATSAGELTGQLLAYAGKSSIIKEEIEVSALVQEASMLIEMSIPKEISVVFSLAADLPVVTCGAAELRQVVMNLITNAAEAIGERKGKIHISTGLAAGMPPPSSTAGAFVTHGNVEGAMVFLRVSDDGDGMEPSTLAKIFDPFFTTKFTGRGLGLAATRGIVEAHQGALSIETSQGEGSIFTLALPCHTPLSTQRPEEAPHPAEPAVLQHRGRTVLVVDDEAMIRRTLGTHLEALGFEVHLACNGREALDTVGRLEAAPDLVVLDLAMPELGGIETRERLRESHPEIRVLLASGHPEERTDGLKGWDPTLDSFLPKPFRRKTLVEQIERLL